MPALAQGLAKAAMTATTRWEATKIRTTIRATLMGGTITRPKMTATTEASTEMIATTPTTVMLAETTV